MRDRSKIFEVLDFINSFNEENGFPPTVREICKELGIKSTATVYDYINELRDKGYLQKAEGKRRAVSVKSSQSVRVPLIGTVTAGQPIFATENYEGTYTLPATEFRGSDLFLLHVQGDSMIEAGIFDGDKVVVQKQQTAENGEIVVALFDDGISEGATVKRYFFRNGKHILHPENAALSDYVLDEVVILGKVVGLLRSY